MTTGQNYQYCNFFFLKFEGICRNQKESEEIRGNQRESEESAGTRRNQKELAGTNRNEKECLRLLDLSQ